jgi:hypothetical protein
MDNKIISLVTLPKIISNEELMYDISRKIDKELAELKIDRIEPIPENLKRIKEIRADLRSEHSFYNNRVAFVKDSILKEFEAFKTLYDEIISSKFNAVDAELKGLIDTVSEYRLAVKTQILKEYFESVNTFEFLNFEDLQIKIKVSDSDKNLNSRVDQYLASIKSSLEIISTLPNKGRVLVNFKISKNLNQAINQAAKELEIEQMENYNENNEIVVTSFKVIGTLSQLASLKAFMNKNGIRYEQ